MELRRLTTREREIALILAEGLSNKEIARRLRISEGTVKLHLHVIYGKLGIFHRLRLAIMIKEHLNAHQGQIS